MKRTERRASCRLESAQYMTRIGFLHNPSTATYACYCLSHFAAAPPSLAVEPLIVSRA
jgi:hypothetical protein